MKYYFRIITLLVLTSFAFNSYGQSEYRLIKSYTDISFSEFVRDVEQSSDLKFYFDNSQLEQVKLLDIPQGTPISEAIDKALRGTVLRYFNRGKDYFIYQGSPIVAELPEYEDHTYKPLPQVTSSVSQDEKQYIQTINLSRDNIITVGREEKYVPGRKCKIYGSIKSRENGEALIGATVYIKELELGTISDVDGNFRLELKPGQYTIAINHMAMKEQDYGLKVLSDGVLAIELENALIELEEITVFDKRRGNVKGMLMGFERITTKSMKEIPVVMGEKDLLKIAQMLPGVQNVGEGSSGFNVRGGSADQNMFYINNISIYNTSHLFGFFTAFSPDIISDFSLYKNNVPAKFGGRIASIFEINTREGNKNHFYAQGGISPITGHFSMEGPIIKEKVTFVASVRSTYSDWILNRINDQDIKNSDARFNDATLALNADINQNNQVKLFLYQSSDKFSLGSRNDYSYSNTGASLALKHKFTKSTSVDLSFSTSNYSFQTIDKNNITEAYIQDYGIRHSEARADFLMLALDNHRVEFGLNSVLYTLNRGDILPYGEESKRIAIDLGTEMGSENSVYLSDEFTLFPRLNMLLGIRYSYYGYLGPANVLTYEEGQPKNKYTVDGEISFAPWEVVKPYTGFEPRAALNFSLTNNSSIKASYNRLQQYIFLLSNTIALAPTDQWKLTDYHIGPPISDQLSFGYYQDIPDQGLNISVEAYKKWISNVVEYRDGVDFISGEPIETQVLQGTQDAYGIELMIKKNTKRLTGWMSYTYSRSTISVNGGIPELMINKGLPYPSNYDRPHSFNLVSNYRISRRLSFSSNVVYTSGRPVTLPIAVYFSEGQEYLLYSDRNEYRIPDYFRIDLSVNLEGNLKFKKLAHSFWMLNVYNATGRNNAYSVFYEARDGQISGYKLSIFAQPIVTLSWNFKFGNYNSD